METSKIVDDLLVTLKYQADASPRSCFVVFSSREQHVEVVIDCIENVFDRSGKYEVVRLDQHLKSGDSQYGELKDLLSTCCFAIVILDGFRPNLLFEYGILKGLEKPCIVLLEEHATVDIQGFFPSSQEGLPPTPEIDMDKHFSDVKDRFYVRYNRNNPKQIREKLQEEYSKLKEQIEEEFLHSLFPHREVLEKELKAHLTAIVDTFSKPEDRLEKKDVATVDIARTHVERIAHQYGITLPHRYFSTLAHTYAKADAVEKAIAVFDSSLVGAPDDVLLLSDKSRILRKASRIDEAIKALDDGIKLKPKAEFLWHDKGIMMDKLGRTEEAIQCYRKAIRLRSGCSTVHYHYGILLYEKDDFTGALTQFDKALRKEPDDPVFLLWKARSLECSGNSDKARRIINKLISENPANANAWFVLGRIEKDDSKALKLFQKAVQLDPKHGGALCSSAARLSNLGENEKALKIFGKISEVCPRHESCPTLFSNICTTLRKLNRPEDAIEMCDKILAKNPKHQDALAAKAVCLAQIGEISTALVIFEDLLSARPDDAELWYDQACTYALAKNSRKAVQSLQKAIAMDGSWKESAKGDTDFDAVRRTKAFRDAFGVGTQRRRKTVTRSGGKTKRYKYKKKQ